MSEKWKTSPFTESCASYYMITDEYGNVICSDVLSKEYAKRIVAAVNRNEALVKALRSARNRSHIALCRLRTRCDEDCRQWTALLADIDKENES